MLVQLEGGIFSFFSHDVENKIILLIISLQSPTHTPVSFFLFQIFSLAIIHANTTYRCGSFEKGKQVWFHYSNILWLSIIPFSLMLTYNLLMISRPQYTQLANQPAT